MRNSSLSGRKPARGFEGKRLMSYGLFDKWNYTKAIKKEKNTGGQNDKIKSEIQVGVIQWNSQHGQQSPVLGSSRN